MDVRYEKILDQMVDVAADSDMRFGGLNAEQLNWKPSETSWSVAQCFDHLITTHSLYFPLLERLASGRVEMSVWEKYSPLSGFFGRFLLKGLDPKNTKKMKTTAKAFPSSSEIGGDIIERFREHQFQMGNAIQALPNNLDGAKQMITSPLMGFVTYSLDYALTFVPMHCVRHFNQAQRVMENDGFPR